MNGIEQIKAERERCSGILKELIKRKKHLDAYVWQERIGGLNYALSVLEERKGSEICWDMLRLVEEFPSPLSSVFRLHFIEKIPICLMADKSCYTEEQVRNYIHEIEKRLDEHFK